MIKLTSGNLLQAPVEALVNTVNTEGVMGKGIALQFKQAFPEMFRNYERACRSGQVQLGKMHVTDLVGLVGGPRWIINFPTKGHWRSRSRIADIKEGLKDLIATVREHGIRSIAVPPLGCGNGGLEWLEVRQLIEEAFRELPDVVVSLYPPSGAPDSAAMPNKTIRPKMTLGQAALVGLMDRYLKGLLDPLITLLEVHKLMYFLKAIGEPLQKLTFQKGTYGPYSPDLRHGLIRMEGHLTRGFGEGSDDPATPLELLPGAVDAAEEFLKGKIETRCRMDRVTSLIQGFEDSYGMELLSSVHWVMVTEPAALGHPDVAIASVGQWNERKRKLLKPEHLKMAWQRLNEQPEFLN